MQTITKYKGSLNGVNYIWTSTYPSDATITETYSVLYPDSNKLLYRDGDVFESVILKDGDTSSNYNELATSSQETTTEDDVYQSLITLTGVVDGLPQATEIDEINATLAILNNV